MPRITFGWLADLVAQIVFADGLPKAQRRVWNLVGFTVVDDATEEWLEITPDSAYIADNGTATPSGAVSGSSFVEGVSTTLVRSDHVHRLGLARVDDTNTASATLTWANDAPSADVTGLLLQQSSGGAGTGKHSSLEAVDAVGGTVFRIATDGSIYGAAVASVPTPTGDDDWSIYGAPTTGQPYARDGDNRAALSPVGLDALDAQWHATNDTINAAGSLAVLTIGLGPTWVGILRYEIVGYDSVDDDTGGAVGEVTIHQSGAASGAVVVDSATAGNASADGDTFVWTVSGSDAILTITNNGANAKNYYTSARIFVRSL